MREGATQRSRRRLRRRAAAIAVLVLAAVVTFAIVSLVFRGGGHRIAAPAPAKAPFVPYSSALLRSGAPWSAQDRARLVHAAAPIVNALEFPPTSGAIFVDPRSGRTLYAHNAMLPLVPASTIKLIVAAAALRDLGPDYRFKTSLVTDGRVDGDVLRGNLYLIGGGDPELAARDLGDAARRLRALGVRSIDGSIVADASIYGPESVNKTWDQDDLRYGWAAPASALTIDNGAVQFTITPDADGGLANIAIDPPASAGQVIGAVKTASESGENTLRIDPLPDGSGFSLSGQIPFGAPQKYWRSVAHPSQTASVVLRTILVRERISVGADPTTGKAPPGATELWAHRSRPLAAIIRHMAFDSDNHIAEQLLLALGQHRSGIGTIDTGIAAERDVLTRLGDAAKPQLVDASGLSPENRVSVTDLAAVLRSMLAGPDAARDVSLFPRVGVEGTVRVRSLAPDVMGRVIGKDGYIQGASGIAGYIKTAHHGIVIFAFLVNGWEYGLDAIWNGENDILDQVARM